METQLPWQQGNLLISQLNESILGSNLAHMSLLIQKMQGIAKAGSPTSSNLKPRLYQKIKNHPLQTETKGPPAFFSKPFCSFGSSRSSALIPRHEIDVYETLFMLLLLSLETAFFISFLQPT